MAEGYDGISLCIMQKWSWGRYPFRLAEYSYYEDKLIEIQVDPNSNIPSEKWDRLWLSPYESEQIEPQSLYFYKWKAEKNTQDSRGEYKCRANRYQGDDDCGKLNDDIYELCILSYNIFNTHYAIEAIREEGISKEKVHPHTNHLIVFHEISESGSKNKCFKAFCLTDRDLTERNGRFYLAEDFNIYSTLRVYNLQEEDILHFPKYDVMVYAHTRLPEQPKAVPVC